MIEMGFDYQSRNILCEKVEFNHKIYEMLQASEHENVYRIDRLRLIEGQPLALHSSYVSETRFPDIGRIGRELASMFQYYQSKGYSVFQSRQTQLRLTYPNKLERELLECSSLIPLLVLESACVDKESGQTLEVSKIMYREIHLLMSSNSAIAGSTRLEAHYEKEAEDRDTHQQTACINEVIGG